MAFGRSNSLSLNTGATNSLFAQQQQPNPQNPSQPQQGSSLFGNNQNQQQVQQGGGLFGSQTASQPQQGGGLFGSTSQNAQTTQPPQSGGLFSNSGQNIQPTQPQQTGSLFGASTTNTGGGLFATGNQQQQQQQQSQPQQSGGLFGASLFGNQNQNQQTSQQPTASAFSINTLGNQQANTTAPSLFSNLGQNQQQHTNAGGSSLFGNLSQKPQQNNTGPSLFGSLSQNQQNTGAGAGVGAGAIGSLGGSIFNSATVPMSQAQQQQPSLLAQSLWNIQQTQTPSFVGSLTMGQANAKNAQQFGLQQTVPGVKIDVSNLKSTTRFSDCHDQIKTDLETIDKLIQDQEKHCRDIEAILPAHETAVNSLKPDVELVTENANACDVSLASDAQAIQGMKGVVQSDIKDFQRVERVVTNLLLPSQYHVPGVSIYGSRSIIQPIQQEEPGYDTDLVGKYLSPLADSLSATLDAYASNLVEIETHLRVLEQGAVQQATVLAAKRAGMGSNSVVGGGEQTVKDLAETLNGFEQGILAAASTVSGCREGVNDLLLRRMGGASGSGRV